jgi:negative regulator of replication initiation
VEAQVTAAAETSPALHAAAAAAATKQKPAAAAVRLLLQRQQQQQQRRSAARALKALQILQNNSSSSSSSREVPQVLASLRNRLCGRSAVATASLQQLLLPVPLLLPRVVLLVLHQTLARRLRSACTG